jgi:hypothetical protein
VLTEIEGLCDVGADVAKAEFEQEGSDIAGSGTDLEDSTALRPEVADVTDDVEGSQHSGSWDRSPPVEPLRQRGNLFGDAAHRRDFIRGEAVYQIWERVLGAAVLHHVEIANRCGLIRNSDRIGLGMEDDRLAAFHDAVRRPQQRDILGRVLLLGSQHPPLPLRWNRRAPFN